ncbi:MAG: alpha/beta hydrolase [Leptolyngbyaceae cyanobacterium bins.302]|nr:alpha/beta hydrolase [Leptolyngbyaceae cyanobacterium bins.302]
MPFLQIRGVNHYYEWMTESGNPDPSGKPVMVFVHGWGGSSRYWESTAKAISDAFDCLLYDLRGFGRSNQIPADLPTSPALYELETFADDLAELLDKLNLSRVYLNAHSAGASIATFFLNRYPQQVEKAILTCSGIFEYDEKSFTTFHKFGGYVVKYRPRWLYQLPFMDRLFMQRFLHRPVPKAISQAFLNDFLLADYATAVGTIYTSVSKYAAEVMPQEFARLSVPTLLIAGERDIIIPAQLGQQAATLNQKNIQLVIMPETAHFPMLEDAPVYLAHVRGFLGIAAPQPINREVNA